MTNILLPHLASLLRTCGSTFFSRKPKKEREGNLRKLLEFHRTHQRKAPPVLAPVMLLISPLFIPQQATHLALRNKANYSQTPLTPNSLPCRLHPLRINNRNEICSRDRLQDTRISAGRSDAAMRSLQMILLRICYSKFVPFVNMLSVNHIPIALIFFPPFFL